MWDRPGSPVAISDVLTVPPSGRRSSRPTAILTSLLREAQARAARSSTLEARATPMGRLFCAQFTLTTDRTAQCSASRRSRLLAGSLHQEYRAHRRRTELTLTPAWVTRCCAETVTPTCNHFQQDHHHESQPRRVPAAQSHRQGPAFDPCRTPHQLGDRAAHVRPAVPQAGAQRPHAAVRDELRGAPHARAPGPRVARGRRGRCPIGTSRRTTSWSSWSGSRPRKRRCCEMRTPRPARGGAALAFL